MEKSIKSLTEKFVGELVALVRKETWAQLASTFGGGAPVDKRVVSRETPREPQPRNRRPKFYKRKGEEIERISQLIVKEVCSTPGHTAKSLGRVIKVQPLDMRRSLFLLKQKNLIDTKGSRSGMRYYPAPKLARAS